MTGDGTKAAFDMGRMAMGGLGQMLDGMEAVKRAWSTTLNLPGSFVPTVDIDELDKRIADLKAVEQWLNMNLSMLRGTVQALEVQRGTLAAIRSFGSSMGANPTDTDAAAALRRAMAEIAQRQAVPPVAPAAAPAPAPAPAPAAPPPRASAPTSAEAPADRGAAPRAKAPRSKPTTAAAAAPLPAINPGAWWNLLQHNFNQVAEAALSGVGLQGASRPAERAATGAGPAAREPAAKPAKAGSKSRRPAARRRAPTRPPEGGR